MNPALRIVALMLLWLTFGSVVAQSPAAELEVAAESADIDDEAIAILKALSDHLASLREFSYRYEASYDAVQSSGMKVEFGSDRRVRVARSDRLRMDTERRDGTRNTIIFSGEKIYAFVPEENVYASASQPGDLEDAIAFAVKELRLKTPASGLVSSSFYEDAIQNLEKAYYLGESTLAGEECDHLLMSNDFTDFQLWITRSSAPVLRRLVINYREEPGQPQFRAQYLKWDLRPEFADSEFEFDPPDDAVRVRFYVEARHLEAAPEDGS